MTETEEMTTAEEWWLSSLSRTGVSLSRSLESYPRWVPIVDATIAAACFAGVLALFVGAAYLGTWLPLLAVPMILGFGTLAGFRYWWLTHLVVVPTPEGLQLRGKKTWVVGWSEIVSIEAGLYWYTIVLIESGRTRTLRRPRGRMTLKAPVPFEHRSPFVNSGPTRRRPPPRA